ncbi:MAG: IS1595 family transposase [Flavobacteriia bacterium]|nr:IS1595 family transposase [Flavobacteriia bacterium]
MKTTRGLSRREFESRFGTNEQCMEFLTNQKWEGGFICRVCHHSQSRVGKKCQFKRCKKCGTEESPTAHTLFHKVKFDIYKAFGMVYDILTSKKGANTIWLAERYEVSQNTAWLFKRKIQAYMGSSKNNLLSGIVHVDEFEIGTPKTGQQGRSATENKSRVVIAVEILNDGKVGNAYGQVIKDFSTKSLKRIFDNQIDTNAQVVTDGWRGYSPLKRIYKRLTQELSNEGKNFPEIHIQIRNLKNWLRGTHSFCEAKTLQDYLNEYFYRFNRRNHRQNIVENGFLKRFLKAKSLTYYEIINLAT